MAIEETTPTATAAAEGLTVSITPEVTGATAPAPEGGEKLLAGKYKTTEELEKAYTELQKKLGKPTSDTSGDDPKLGEESAAEEAPEAEATKKPEDAPKPELATDEQIATELEAKSLKLADFQAEYAEKGGLSPESYAKLAKAGYAKDVVDQFIAAREAQVQAATAVQKAELAAMYAEYGSGDAAKGEAELTAAINWAATNLSDSEKAKFNKLTESGDMDIIKIAVAGLHAKYTKATGSEPKLLAGTAGQPNGDVFRSQAEVTAAMKDPRYKKDPAYRADVEQRLLRSPI